MENKKEGTRAIALLCARSNLCLPSPALGSIRITLIPADLLFLF
jgi:hypothetical protein